jgi:hypothetical protein
MSLWRPARYFQEMPSDGGGVPAATNASGPFRTGSRPRVARSAPQTDASSIVVQQLSGKTRMLILKPMKITDQPLDQAPMDLIDDAEVLHV